MKETFRNLELMREVMKDLRSHGGKCMIIRTKPDDVKIRCRLLDRRLWEIVEIQEELFSEDAIVTGNCTTI